MALSEGYGLERFSEYMKGLEDCYAVIGGTACSILLANADLDFRATKDIDVILLIEDRLPETATAMWRLVKAGRGHRVASTRIRIVGATLRRSAWRTVTSCASQKVASSTSARSPPSSPMSMAGSSPPWKTASRSLSRASMRPTSNRSSV